MSEKDTTHNGWTNYETWAVALWIDNEEWSQERAQEIARDARREGPEHVNVKSGIWDAARAEVYILSDELKTWVRDTPPDDGGMLPDLGATLASDLLGAAVSEVNWYEIAEHYLADLPTAEEEEEEGDDCSDPAETACGPEPEPTED